MSLFSPLFHSHKNKQIYSIQINSRTPSTLVSWEAASVDCDVNMLRQFDSYPEGMCPRFDRISQLKLFVCLFFDMSQVKNQIVHLVI